MRDLRLLDLYRDRSPSVIQIYGTVGGQYFGVFRIFEMLVIASADAGWDHVSVSRKDKIPTWDNMQHIKNIFFKDDEVAMQLHVPKKDHISNFNNCLHLWRPWDLIGGVAIPIPPKEMV